MHNLVHFTCTLRWADWSHAAHSERAARVFATGPELLSVHDCEHLRGEAADLQRASDRSECDHDLPGDANHRQRPKLHVRLHCSPQPEVRPGQDHY